MKWILRRWTIHKVDEDEDEDGEEDDADNEEEDSNNNNNNNPRNIKKTDLQVHTHVPYSRKSRCQRK